MNKKINIKETSIEEFDKAIQKLPKHEYREAWLRWLRGYDGPGPFGRQNDKERTAKFVYNQLAYPEMLLWLIEAAGVGKHLVSLAKSACDGVDNVRRKSAAIRKRVPWKALEPALWR